LNTFLKNKRYSRRGGARPSARSS